MTTELATLSIVRGWVECSGPVTAGELAATLRLDSADVGYALAQLEGEGLVLRGSFRSGAVEEEFCDRRILARIHRSTLGRLRRLDRAGFPGRPDAVPAPVAASGPGDRGSG